MKKDLAVVYLACVFISLLLGNVSFLIGATIGACLTYCLIS